MDKLIVTTAYRSSEQRTDTAKEIAKQLNVQYVKRNKRSVPSLMEQYHCGVIVVGKERLTVQLTPTTSPLFFHPNGAMFRAKRWLKAKEDPLIQACKIEEGDRLLDGTLGLGSDAILASMAAGAKGKVIGTEQSLLLSFIVKEGLSTYKSNVPEIDQALRRIEVVNMSHKDWLKSAEDKSVDIIYFDPMFQEEVTGSHGFDSIRTFTVNSPLTEEVIVEAKRVAKKRIVLKDHFRSKRFEQFGFHVQVRPSATYHFGTIELQETR